MDSFDFFTLERNDDDHNDGAEDIPPLEKEPPINKKTRKIDNATVEQSHPTVAGPRKQTVSTIPVTEEEQKTERDGEEENEINPPLTKQNKRARPVTAPSASLSNNGGGGGGVREPFFVKNKYEMDVDAFLSELKCSNNHRYRDASSKDLDDSIEDGKNGPWVTPQIHRLRDYEIQSAQEIEATAKRIGNGARLTLGLITLKDDKASEFKWVTGKRTKPTVLLGNKYIPRRPKKEEDRIPRVWLIVSSEEHRLWKMYKHLPYALLASLEGTDMIFIRENLEFQRGKERKTFTDLWGSTKSGHKASQIARLQDRGFTLSEVEWLFEMPSPGLECESCQRENSSQSNMNPMLLWTADLQACESNLINRDGFSIRHTRGLLHTGALILRDLQTIMEFGMKCTRPAKYTEPSEMPIFTQDNINSYVSELMDWIKETQHTTISPWHADTRQVAQRAMTAVSKLTAHKPKDYQADEIAWTAHLISRCNGIGEAASLDIALQVKSVRGLLEKYQEIDTKYSSTSLEEPDSPLLSSSLSSNSNKGRKRLRQDPDDNGGIEDASTEDDLDSGSLSTQSLKQLLKPRAKKKPVKKGGRKKQADSGQDRIEELAFMLADVETKSQKSVGKAKSRTIWLQFYANAHDKELWSNHPKNTYDKKRKQQKKKQQQQQQKDDDDEFIDNTEEDNGDGSVTSPPPSKKKPVGNKRKSQPDPIDSPVLVKIDEGEPEELVKDESVSEGWSIDGENDLSSSLEFI